MDSMDFRILLLTIFASLLSFVNCQNTCPASSSGCQYKNVAITPSTNVLPNKHYYIAGLFGVHDFVSDVYSCSEAPIRDKGLINLEAFHWAIKKYATNNLVSVGGVSLDSCARVENTLENILSFETCKVQLGTTNRPSPRNLLAYVGPDKSAEAVSSALLLKDMKKTMVSHAATSPALSDSTTYPYFLRTVPSDEYDAKIMTSLLLSLKLKYVLVVYVGNAYGRDGYATLKTKLDNSTVCIVKSFELPDGASTAQQNSVIDDLVTKKSVRYVVLYAESGTAKTFLNAFQNRHSNDFQNMVFIGTSSWGTNTDVTNNLQISAYTVSLSYPASLQNDVNEFYTYLDNLKPTAANVYNPWFQAFWDAKLECSTRTCNEATDSLKGKYTRLAYVPFTLLAVKSIIQGVEKVALDTCGQYELCSNLLNQKTRGQKIFEGIRNTVFKANGDIKDDNIIYKVMLYQTVGNQYKEIAAYNPTSGLTFSQSIQPFSSVCPSSPCTECGEELTTTVPTTVMATTKIPETTTADPTEGGKYAHIKFLHDQSFTGVYLSQSRTQYDTRFEINQKWIIALGVLSGLGMLAVVVFEIYIMYKLLDSKIGRQWRTMWLGQLLLFGIFLAYLTILAFLWIPTKATCGITRMGIGVSYAMIYAVLLVKLMVILTSKTSESISPSDIESPNYLKGIYQFLMFIFAVGVQVVIDIQWLIQVPPEAVKVMDNSGNEAWICNHYSWSAEFGWLDMKTFVRSEFENHLLSLVYVMFLILITTIVAMKSHGIITNHRESVFIGIAAGFSIPIWIAWGLVGGLNGDGPSGHQYGDASLAFGLFACATLALFAMFLPKVRQLVNMGVEGIYLEDDRDTYYAGSVIMPPPSYKSRPSSVIYANSGGGIYSDPVLIGSSLNGDPHSLHLKHPGTTHLGPSSTYSAPVYLKRRDNMGNSKVLKVTEDLRGKLPINKPASEIDAPAGSYRRTRSEMGTLTRKSLSQSNLGAL